MIDRQERAVAGTTLPAYSLNTVVVGSGAAGLSCAVRVFREMQAAGVPDAAAEVALVTQGVGAGTSNNAGSDKQTYYKLGVHGRQADTPRDVAETLVAGGCMHGDLALAEAENSLRAFHHLVDIGVPFPHNALGGFVGYKTDNDPRRRATSAGPWTSRFMVRGLLAELEACGVPVFDRHHVIAVVTDGDRALGLLCADMDRLDADGHGLALFNCRNVVMAGGGPGELYAASVYPAGQMGPYAALLEAGAVAHNLTESQFGIASLEPRWNLSGTYQQVIPRYFSTAPDGGDVRELLTPWFPTLSDLATATFLKGYQWPFDPDKVANGGSSLIDLIVHRETVHEGRHAYLDFRENPRPRPGADPFDLRALRPEARDYLARSGADQPRPIDRLAHMNPPSADLYRERGVELEREPLRIGVCAQHCNGGFAVDAWWESTVAHLFVIGELAGTHGVKRPGGAALNAGQVGALRAAQRIVHVYGEAAHALDDFMACAAPVVARVRAAVERIRQPGSGALDCDDVKQSIQQRMSRHAGMIRSASGVRQALDEAGREWRAIEERGLVAAKGPYLKALEVRELALAQRAFLEAIRGLIEHGGGSRGSYLVTAPDGAVLHPDLGDAWRALPENQALRQEILGVTYDLQTDAFTLETTPPRPIPDEETWFETTWAAFRSGAVFHESSGHDT